MYFLQFVTILTSVLNTLQFTHIWENYQNGVIIYYNYLNLQYVKYFSGLQLSGDLAAYVAIVIFIGNCFKPTNNWK